MNVSKAKSIIGLKRPAVLFALILIFSAILCSKGIYLPILLGAVCLVVIAFIQIRKSSSLILFLSATLLLYPMFYVSVSSMTVQNTPLFENQTVSLKGVVIDKTEFYDKTVLYVKLSEKDFSNIKAAVVYDSSISCNLYDLVEISGISFSMLDEKQTELFTQNFPSKEKALSKGCFCGIYALDIENRGRIPKNQRTVLHSFNYYLRDNMKKSFDDFLTTDTFAMSIALLSGDRSYLSDSTEDFFTKSGLVALLCISGLHVVISASFIEFFMKKFKINMKIRAFIMFIFLFLFMVITGFRGSVMRACIMSTIYYFSKAFSKHRDSFSVLAVSFIVISLFNPFCIFDISTRLSFLAMMGLVFSSICKDSFFENTQTLFYKIKQGILTSFYAQTFASVPIFTLFGGISVIAPFSNIFAGLIFSPLMIMLVFCAIFCFLPARIFSIFAIVPKFFIFLLDHTARFFASIPFVYAELQLPNFISLAFLIFFFVFMFCVTFLKNKAVIISGYASFFLSNSVILTSMVISFICN